MSNQLGEVMRQIRQNNLKNIKETYCSMKKTKEYLNRGKCGRLYMICLQVDMNHNTVAKMLKELNIEL